MHDVVVPAREAGGLERGHPVDDGHVLADLPDRAPAGALLGERCAPHAEGLPALDPPPAGCDLGGSLMTVDVDLPEPSTVDGIAGHLGLGDDPTVALAR